LALSQRLFGDLRSKSEEQRLRGGSTPLPALSPTEQSIVISSGGAAACPLSRLCEAVTVVSLRVLCAAVAFRNHVEAEARESSGDVFARTMNDVSLILAPPASVRLPLDTSAASPTDSDPIAMQVYAMLSSLVNSSVAEERLGGVLGIDALIEVRSLLCRLGNRSALIVPRRDGDLAGGLRGDGQQNHAFLCIHQTDPGAQPSLVY
jgi:hypothetical protein